LIVIKENGRIKMKEVFKDYGTLWKVELEPAKATSERIKDRFGISQNQLHAEWKNNLVYLRETTNNNKKTVWKLKYKPPTQ